MKKWWKAGWWIPLLALGLTGLILASVVQAQRSIRPAAPGPETPDPSAPANYEIGDAKPASGDHIGMRTVDPEKNVFHSKLLSSLRENERLAAMAEAKRIAEEAEAARVAAEAEAKRKAEEEARLLAEAEEKKKAEEEEAKRKAEEEARLAKEKAEAEAAAAAASKPEPPAPPPPPELVIVTYQGMLGAGGTLGALVKVDDGAADYHRVGDKVGPFTIVSIERAALGVRAPSGRVLDLPAGDAKSFTKDGIPHEAKE